MNRTILIVICDFLLVSLLAFSTVDINKVSDVSTHREVRVEIATNQIAESGKDLTAVMRMALDEERKGRDMLLGELNRTRDSLGKQQALLTERERQIQSVQQELQAKELQAQQQQALIAERERQIQAVQRDLQARDQQAQQLQQNLQTKEQERVRLQQEQAALHERFAAAQTNIQGLGAQLKASSTEALLSKERIAAMEAEIRKQMEQAAIMQKQIANLAVSNQTVLAEKQQLSGQLQVAQVERRHATEQVAKMEQQVAVEREEKAKLAEGVKVLAAKSSDLEKEVRENRPLASNTIFNEFVKNRVQARFSGTRPGLLTDATKNKEAGTVLVTNGTNIFALCHVQDTPFTFWNPGTEWQSLSGTMGHNVTFLPIRSVSFLLEDPRVVVIPVAREEAEKLGCKVYETVSDPFKFQDAVLVGAVDQYYGECRFQIDVTTPGYLKLDTGFLKGLFGKFNPSRGDLVFSRTGHLLGVMANSSYCLMLRGFDTTATFQFGKDMKDQRTGDTLTRLYNKVDGFPSRLQ